MYILSLSVLLLSRVVLPVNQRNIIISDHNINVWLCQII